MDRRTLLGMIAALAAGPGVARASEAAKKKKGGGLSFIQLGAVSATVFKADGRRGVISVEVGIDTISQAQHDKAELLAPRFRAAFVQSVQIYAAGLPPGAVPDADYLARELQRQTDLVLGEKGARFLLGTILIT